MSTAHTHKLRQGGRRGKCQAVSALPVRAEQHSARPTTKICLIKNSEGKTDSESKTEKKERNNEVYRKMSLSSCSFFLAHSEKKMVGDGLLRTFRKQKASGSLLGLMSQHLS